MQEDIRIGLVQLEAKVGETRKNLNQILHWTEKASKQGVKMLCFPESALHGYSPKDALEIGNTIDSQEIRELKECASDLDVILLVGMVEKTEQGQKPYLSQIIIFPDRDPAVYRKVHLGRSEKAYFMPGSEFPVFEAKGVRFAVGICWDWHFPEMATIYSLKGAELLFAPHASPVVAGDRKEIWKRYLGTRAYDNSVYLAACNLVGANNRGQEFSGGALVFGPKGETIAESFNTAESLDNHDKHDNQEQLITLEISAQRINNLRNTERVSMKDSFFLADRQKELYREIIELDVFHGNRT